MAESYIVRRVSGGGEIAPFVASQDIFIGATVPLTYRNAAPTYTDAYIYTYVSSRHNITIAGLDGRATISGNGSKNVIVTFITTSTTSSLKNFTITCVNDDETLIFNGLHAHYGTELTSNQVLSFFTLTKTKDGSEGTLNVNYKFYVDTGTSGIPTFGAQTTTFAGNPFFSHMLLNVCLVRYTISYIPSSAFRYCYNFNQPLTIPSTVNEITSNFLGDAYSFNQPIKFNSNNVFISDNFLQNAWSFNQPFTIPSGISGVDFIGNGFMFGCRSFNQPLAFPDDGTIINTGNNFLRDATAFNKIIKIPNTITTIGTQFLQNANSFNQPLTLPNNITRIPVSFLQSCNSFNQPLTIPSTVTTINPYFLFNNYAFDQPLTIPSTVTSVVSDFLVNCYSLTTLIYNSTAYILDTTVSLTQDINTKTSSNGVGIYVYGAGRAQLVSNLPNRTSSPFRKLVNGGS
jgi:hypothetical protein